MTKHIQQSLPLTTHAVMINTEDSLDARQPLILWLFTIK